jgi:tetratricopeptide (TPR) repeat protein
MNGLMRGAFDGSNAAGAAGKARVEKISFFSFLITGIFLCFLVPVCMSASDNPVDAANNFFKNGRYKEALEIYTKVIATYPGTDWAIMSHLMSARSLEKTGRNDDAIEEYKTIINKYPKSDIAEEAYFSVARMRADKGQSENAVKAYRSYLKAYPMGQFRVMALFNIALLYKEKGDNKNALPAYGEILKSYANEPWFYSWAAIYSGHIYMGEKDYDRAIECYQRVINSSDNNFLYNLALLHRGSAFTEKKDYKAAVALFQQLLKTNNYFAEEALFGMGKANYKAGEFEMAKESLTTLLQLFPATVWKNDAESKLKTIEKRIKAERAEE